MFKRLMIFMVWAFWTQLINPDVPLGRDARLFMNIYGPICLCLAWVMGRKTNMPLTDQCFISVFGLIALRNVWRDWMFARKKETSDE